MKIEVLPPAAQPTETAIPLMRSSTDKKQIQIIKTFFLRGPSIWTYRPVIEAWVDIGDLEDSPSNTIPGFYERLSSWLPSLVEHRCGIGERGGFLQRLREGTWPAHILEHVAIELQTLAGIPTGFGKAREMSRRGVYKVVVRTPHEKTGLAALYAARDLVMAAIENRSHDIPAAIDGLRAVAQDVCLSPASACISDAAADLRIPSIRLGNGDLLQLGYGARQQRVWAGDTSRTSAIAQGIAADLMLSRKLLQSCGVAVPEGRVVVSAQDAWEAAQDIGMPVVVKSEAGHGGLGVSLALYTRAEIEAAHRTASEIDSEVLVERFVAGSKHRLLVVGGRVVAAVRLDNGRGAQDRNASDVTDLIHPDIAALASLAARVVGLDIAGVDVVAKDISFPLNVQQGAITGIDARPNLLMHSKPAQGAPRPVGHAIVEHLFADNDSGRIPVVGICGSRGKTTAAQLISRLLRLQGARVGLACSDGVYLGQRQIGQGDCANWQSAQRVLRNPAIDAAVFENGYRSILSEGLAYDRCKVGIVTNMDAADVVPEYDINDAGQMAKVVRTQVDVVLPDGVAILNAADPHVAELAPLCDGEVIFFGATADLPALAEYRNRGGRAVFLDGARLVFASGHEASAIPLALKGRPAGELDGILAASGAAWALGLPLALIRAGLESFDAEFQPAPRTTVTLETLATLATLADAWPHTTTAQPRESVHGNITDQGIARPESMEPPHRHRSHCYLLGA